MFRAVAQGQPSGCLPKRVYVPRANNLCCGNYYIVSCRLSTKVVHTALGITASSGVTSIWYMVPHQNLQVQRDVLKPYRFRFLQNLI